MLPLLTSLFLPANAEDINHVANPIVVLISDNLPEYEETQRAFNEVYPSSSVRVMQIDGNKPQALRHIKELQEKPPPLVFAIGTKAAYITIQEMPNTPCIYAMVHDPIKYGIYGKNVTGISSQVPAEVTLSQLQLFVPEARKIAVFISDSASLDLVNNATAAARQMGLDLQLVRISSNLELRKELSTLVKEIDAIWLLPDPEIVTPENFHTINAMAQRSKIPVVSNSELLAQAGTLFSVTPKGSVVGQQAAELAYAILNDPNTSYGGAIYMPELPHIVLNEETQRTIGLDIDPFAKGFVDKIVP